MLFEKAIAEKPEVYEAMQEDFSDVFGDIELLLEASQAVNNFSGLDHSSMTEEQISAARETLYNAVPENVLESIGGIEQANDAFVVKAQSALGKLIGEKWDKFVTWYSGKDYDKQAKTLIEKLKTSEEIGGRYVTHYNASPVTQNKGKELVPASTLAARLSSLSKIDSQMDAMLDVATKAKGKEFKDIFQTVAKKAFGYIGRDNDGYYYVGFDQKSDFVLSAIDTLDEVPLDWNVEYWFHKPQPRSTHSTADAIKVLGNISGIEGSLKKISDKLKHKWTEVKLDLNKEEISRIRNVLSFMYDYMLFSHAFVKGVLTLYKESMKAPKAQSSKENASASPLSLNDIQFILQEELELVAVQQELDVLLEAQNALEQHTEVCNGGWVQPELEKIANDRLYSVVDKTLIDSMGGIVAAKQGVKDKVSDVIKRVLAKLWEFLKKLAGVDFESRIDELLYGFNNDAFVITEQEKMIGSAPTVGITRANVAMNLRDFQVNVNALLRSRTNDLVVAALGDNKMNGRNSATACINIAKDVFPTYGVSKGKYVLGTSKKGGSYWLEATMADNGKLSWRANTTKGAVKVPATGASVKLANDVAEDLKSAWKYLVDMEKNVAKAAKKSSEIEPVAVSNIVNTTKELAKYNRMLCTDGWKFLSVITEKNKQSNLDKTS